MNNILADSKSTLKKVWQTNTGKIVIISAGAIVAFYLSGKLLKLATGVVTEYKNFKNVLDK